MFYYEKKTTQISVFKQLHIPSWILKLSSTLQCWGNSCTMRRMLLPSATSQTKPDTNYPSLTPFALVRYSYTASKLQYTACIICFLVKNKSPFFNEILPIFSGILENWLENFLAISIPKISSSFNEIIS